MENNYVRIITILYIFCSLASSLIAKDSLEVYFQNLNNSIKSIKRLQKKNKKFNSKIETINNKIEQIKGDDDINWFEKLKLSRLTNRKAKLNDNVITNYEKIQDKKVKTRNIFKNTFLIIEHKIDSLINYYNSVEDSNNQKKYIQEVIELKNKRDWLGKNQKYFLTSQHVDELEIEGLDSLMKKIKKNSTLKRRLVSLLKNRINKMDAMINSAQQERQLRKKLNKFNEEMNGITDESFAQSKIEKTQDNDKKDRSTGGEPLSGGSPPTYGEDYSDWNKNTVSIASSPSEISNTDYLYLYQDVSQKKINSSIDNLDSLKILYKKLLNRISD